MTAHPHQSVFQIDSSPKFTRVSSPELSSVIALSAFRCTWRSRIEARLIQLGCLKLGWDGHGGKPVNRATLDFAIKILVDLMRPGVPEPSIGATSYGGVQIEWHRSGWDMEIEIVAPNQLDLFTRNVRTGEIEEFSLGIVLDRLNHAVNLIKD